VSAGATSDATVGVGTDLAVVDPDAFHAVTATLIV
jgi:hypothetical protein